MMHSVRPTSVPASQTWPGGFFFEKKAGSGSCPLFSYTLHCLMAVTRILRRQEKLESKEYERLFVDVMFCLDNALWSWTAAVWRTCSDAGKMSMENQKNALKSGAANLWREGLFDRAV